MLFTAVLLAALAIVLAWPIPRLLATYPASRDPAFRLLLWQAIGLAGGLSLVSAVIIFAFVPFTEHTGLSGLADWRSLHLLSWWHWGLAALGVALLARLLTSLLVHWLQVRRRRQRHAALIALLAEPSQELPNTRILPASEIVAYCLPSGQQGTTVLSSGLIAALSPAERDAVIAHERAHLRSRHELVVLPFAAWQHALPFVPAAQAAHDQVTRLIEVMADDTARAEVPAGDLAAAVRTMSREHAADYSRDLSAERLARLDHPLPQVSPGLRAAIVAVCALLVLSPPVVAVLELLNV